MNPKLVMEGDSSLAKHSHFPWLDIEDESKYIKTVILNDHNKSHTIDFD